MKHIVIIFLIALITVTIPAAAQWKEMPGDFGVQVTAFGAHDTTLFMAVPGNLWRITTNSVQQANDGISFAQGSYVSSFATLGNDFFVGTIDQYGDIGPVYSSSNEGANWTSTTEGEPIATNGKYLFATGAYLDGTKIIYFMVRSRDSGKSWDSVASFNALSTAAIGINIFANTGSTIMRSTDTGNHWSQLSTPFLGNMMTMGALLFIVDSTGGRVTESSDNGLDWNSVTVDSAGTPVKVRRLATDGRNLFVGSKINGVYWSHDTGRTWHVANDGFGTGIGDLDVFNLGVFDTFLVVNIASLYESKYAVFIRSIPQLVDTAPASVMQPSVSDSIEIYPNPATGTITVFTSGSSLLGLSVLNVLGTDIFDIPKINASTATLDLSKCVSGTYFIRIQTETASVLKKITLER